jgi:hypothetical protein
MLSSSTLLSPTLLSPTLLASESSYASLTKFRCSSRASSGVQCRRTLRLAVARVGEGGSSAAGVLPARAREKRAEPVTSKGVRSKLRFLGRGMGWRCVLAGTDGRGGLVEEKDVIAS